MCGDCGKGGESLYLRRARRADRRSNTTRKTNGPTTVPKVSQKGTKKNQRSSSSSSSSSSRVNKKVKMGKKGGTRRRLAKKVSSLRGSSAAQDDPVSQNKFNMRNNKRLKHEVAGRKIRGQSSNVPEVRARQENERKSTLLVEYNNLNRANAFVDKRVGELDDSISKEDKALMRYQRQRQKQFAKTSRFNLGDSDEDEVVESYGQSLGGDGGGSWDEDASGHTGAGGEGGDDDEYEEDEEMGGFRLKNARSGDSADAPVPGRGPKTKREILAEVISKNRFYRAQRAQDKEDFEDEVDELDEGLDDMLSLLNARSDDAKARSREVRKEHKGDTEAAAQAATAALAGGNGAISIETYDDYDLSRRAMANEARAAASAKRKDNPQTRMKEARQKLIQLERLRKDSPQAASAGSASGQQKKKQTGVTPADIAEARTRHELAEETNVTETAPGGEQQSRVPFTPACPQTARELADSIEEYCGSSVSELDKYLRHIRIMHSIVHDPRNGSKLCVLLGLLIDRFLTSFQPDSDFQVATASTSGQAAPRGTGSDNDNNNESDSDSDADGNIAAGPADKPLRATDEPQTLSLHVWKIAQEIPLQASKIFAEAIERACCGVVKEKSDAGADEENSGSDSDLDSDGEDVRDSSKHSGQRRTRFVGDSTERLALPQLALLRLTTIVFDLEWSGRFLRQVILLVLGRALLLSGRTASPEEHDQKLTTDNLKTSPVQDLWRGLCAVALTLDAADRATIDDAQVDSSRDSGELGVVQAPPDLVPEVLVFLFAALERIVSALEHHVGSGAGVKVATKSQHKKQSKDLVTAKTAGAKQLQEAGMLCFRGSVTECSWRWVVGGCAAVDALDNLKEAPVDVWTSSQLLQALLVTATATPGDVSCTAASAALGLLERAMRKFSSSPSFPELLDPFVPLLRKVNVVVEKIDSQKKSKAPNNKAAYQRLAENCGQLLEQLQRRLTSARDNRCALTRATQVRAVEQFAPAFDETGFNPKKSNDPAADYIKGLKQKARQERKNAARELRRDAAFVAAVRDEEHAKRDLRVKRKVNDAMVFLQNQEATYKQMVKQGTTRGAGSGGGGVKKKKRF